MGLYTQEQSAIRDRADGIDNPKKPYSTVLVCHALAARSHQPYFETIQQDADPCQDSKSTTTQLCALPGIAATVLSSTLNDNIRP